MSTCVTKWKAPLIINLGVRFTNWSSVPNWSENVRIITENYNQVNVLFGS